MIIDKVIKIKINPKIYSFYEKKGYVVPKVPSTVNPSKMVYPKTAEIYVNQKDLSRGSQVYVDCICDCCGKEYSIPFENAYASIEKFGETFCYQCRHVHIKKTNMQRYGVENASQSEEIKKRIRETSISRWGGIGFASPQLSKRTKETMIQRYGVNHPSLSPEIQKKKEVSILEKYGKKNILMIPEYYQKARDKMHQNGTAPCSSQQRYIFDFLRKYYRAELNFPFSAYFLDIFLQDFSCDIEYDGSGHWLSVHKNSISEEEFKKKEIIRSYQIKKKGITTIRLISKKNHIPVNSQLLEIVADSLSYFNKTGHTWREYDIDKEEYRDAEHQNGAPFMFETWSANMLSTYSEEKIKSLLEN